MEPLDRQIRALVANYVQGELSLGELEERFIPMTWDVTADDGHATVDLIDEITGVLAEATSSVTTEDQAREALSRLAPTWAVASGGIRTGSTAVVHNSRLTSTWSAAADRRHAAASA